MAGFKKPKSYGSATMGSTGFQAVVSNPSPPNAPTIGTATNVGTNRAYNNGAAVVTFTRGSGGGVPTSFTVTS